MTATVGPLDTAEQRGQSCAVADRFRDLDRAVAQAADAWLSAPTDWRAYAFLVEAIQARRAYVQPQLPGVDAPTTRAVDDATQPEEVLDGLAEGRPVTVVGDLLDGDTESALERLRQPGESAPRWGT